VVSGGGSGDCVKAPQAVFAAYGAKPVKGAVRPWAALPSFGARGGALVPEQGAGPAGMSDGGGHYSAGGVGGRRVRFMP
jgi:hypothetical protein